MKEHRLILITETNRRTKQRQLAKKLFLRSLAYTYLPLLPLLLISGSFLLTFFVGLPIFIVISNVLCHRNGVGNAHIHERTQEEWDTSDDRIRDGAGIHAATVYASSGAAYQSYATRTDVTAYHR